MVAAVLESGSGGVLKGSGRGPGGVREASGRRPGGVWEASEKCSKRVRNVSDRRPRPKRDRALKKVGVPREECAFV